LRDIDQGAVAVADGQAVVAERFVVGDLVEKQIQPARLVGADLNAVRRQRDGPGIAHADRVALRRR
jgi:hypothetical protein